MPDETPQPARRREPNFSNFITQFATQMVIEKITADLEIALDALSPDDEDRVPDVAAFREAMARVSVAAADLARWAGGIQ